MPFIQLRKVNFAVALYRRKQEVDKMSNMLDLMLGDYIQEELNESEFKEYAELTGDREHTKIVVVGQSSEGGKTK